MTRLAYIVPIVSVSLTAAASYFMYLLALSICTNG